MSFTGKPLSSRRLSTLTTPCPHDLDALLETVTKQVQKKARGMKAPLACIEAVRASTMPYNQGIKRESELMATLFNSDQARALQYSFFAQRTAGKWTLPSGAQWIDCKPRDIQSVAVIGVCLLDQGLFRTIDITNGLVGVVSVEDFSLVLPLMFLSLAPSSAAL
ncbi:hypothetical protein DNTS_020624 [Danionella cerebrum]|uniref:Uncharacterized protein n=1 Tax=Danionella cerebrum TaxID=2873325 RepID=A0A553RFN9_9TELE|nr:hypothetical protein DNTS_020624 [Danionella translucida]